MKQTNINRIKFVVKLNISFVKLQTSVFLVIIVVDVASLRIKLVVKRRHNRSSRRVTVILVSVTFYHRGKT